MIENKDIVEKAIKKLQKDVEYLKTDIKDKFNFLNKKISGIKTELKRDIKALWQGQLRIEEKIENLKDESDKKFEEANRHRRKDKDEMMNKLDYIIGELQTMREENTIGAYHMRELRVEVDDHEKRLTKLERHH